MTQVYFKLLDTPCLAGQQAPLCSFVTAAAHGLHGLHMSFKLCKGMSAIVLPFCPLPSSLHSGYPTVRQMDGELYPCTMMLTRLLHANTSAPPFDVLQAQRA